MARALALGLALGLGLVAAAARAAEDPPKADSAAREFEAATVPLVRHYCLECHSAEEQEADLDLERFARLDQVRAAPRVWARVGAVLDSGEMPPRDSPQPSPAERDRLRGWVRTFLAAEAARRAGDPGRVVLRRLNNAEYTYTLRDLTGLPDLDPARDFPADGAAGEGFTNAGAALGVSPSLVTKYLDAAKGVAAHAVLLPDGFRFAAGTTPRDWTEDRLAAIRRFYARFTDPGRAGGTAVNLQGIRFETNGGGRLAVDRYLAATLAGRPGLAAGTTTIVALAAEHGLNPRYLGTLWDALHAPTPSPLLADLQARWRVARPEDAPALAAEVAAWQRELWRFRSVGHIGKVGGPTRWMEPVDPLATRRDFRFKLPPAPPGTDGVTVSLVAGDAGDGPERDLALWRAPRIVAPGRPDIPLRDLRAAAVELAARSDRLFDRTADYLAAVSDAQAPSSPAAVGELAAGRGLDPAGLRAWLDLLGVPSAEPWVVTGHFDRQVKAAGGHAAVSGWSRGELPQLLANASDEAIRVPGTIKPRGVAVHPSPSSRAVVAWQSPVAATVRVVGIVEHAHHACGNGVAWALDLRRGSARTRLASGIAQGPGAVAVGPVEGLACRPGDGLSLAVGARDGNHGCDLTAVDLRVVEVGGAGRAWDLAADVAGDVLAGNPHADRLGHPAVWHFGDEPDRVGDEASPALPAGSPLARWRAAGNPTERARLAAEVERTLRAPRPADLDGPAAELRRLLRSAGGPLLGAVLRDRPLGRGRHDPAGLGDVGWGLDPAAFGAGPGVGAIDPTDLVMAAPAVGSFRIPTELLDGAELVTAGTLAPGAGTEGSVQLDVVLGVPVAVPGLRAGGATTAAGGANWAATTATTAFGAPVLVGEGTAARRRLHQAFDDFRASFPAALCYGQIVPVDEVVTLTLFHREDEPLTRLMLDEHDRAELDRLWGELHFVGRDALTLVDAFGQLLEYASQDADPKVFEPLRQPILDRAAAFRRELAAAEPRQVAALVDFADRAYRRPLLAAERDQLRGFHAKLRAEGIGHDEAFRLTLARVLASPAFLYRAERPVPGAGQGPVAAHEMATRLGYFLGSSGPDAELRALADSGRLLDPATLREQAGRLRHDPMRARRLAVEFAGHWLGVADFDQLDEKSERHFPTFRALRGAMHEETTRFLADLFRADGSVLDLLDADHTFLNPALAEHYGIPLGAPGEAPPDGWRRVDGIRRYGRGGILGQASTLARHSGAARTSPTLRGDWIGEVLLGERLPRPPKGVPQLPDDEAATAGLTVRQLVERHAADPKCASCHARVDPPGMALERYDAIGRRRDSDLAGRPIDDRARAADGAEFAGLEGLRGYLLTARRDAFVRQFCRKLLGFALARSVELADEPLLAEMQAALKAQDYRVAAAIEAIVMSPQFREIRGREFVDVD